MLIKTCRVVETTRRRECGSGVTGYVRQVASNARTEAVALELQ